ncbi:ABC-2 type transport system permease protein [Streptomyces sp. 1222.5]|uniref:ABC transporter permease n=1 Tax=unclassified Streptomyces TaxID=2593676 RepID=UPI0008957028|nr:MULTISPECIES: ABC transporter permease [unclassified Streptomyces]PKW09361.1 ABC-2 type transport system permease protein [Streptomyces sp. 5112.2]SEC37310.1 ABC-2 type transport system permease protein [Streptomyces sp. 1222.5]SED53820.1 ABC-2 type transport system permease protein [Streptomyces sp. 2231.1]
MPLTEAAGVRPSVAAPARPAARGARGLGRACAARASVELKAFFRNKQSLVFTLFFPVLLLVVFGSIFSGKVEGTDTDFRQVFMAGVIAAGVMSTAFSGLAINVAIERDTGTVRRLALTPMPKSAYFVGKLVRVVVTTVLETVLLIGIAVTAFGLPLPGTAQRWATLGWCLALGTAACALAGIAYSALIPNSRSAAAVVTPVFMVLQFISGVFYPFDKLPLWMQNTAALFPVKWMAQGFRSVFLPDSFTAVEPAGSWELGRIALVLTAWAVGGLLATTLTFGWRGPRVR